jgi:uncharacterized membrane protein
VLVIGFAWIFLGERITWMAMGGGLLILLGALMLAFSQ